LAFRRKMKINKQQKLPLNHNLDAVEEDCFNAIVPTYRITDARNIAIAAYKNPINPQELDYIMRFSDPVNDLHSEQLILDYFKANGLNTTDIIAWYSELQPCNANNHNCRKLVFSQSPSAFVYFSFNYDMNNTHLYELNKHELFVKSQKF
jgi:Xanthomonas XOO_2897-like deaminase